MSDALGIDVKTVDRWLKGTSMPKFSDVARVAQLADVTLDWIATGEGPKIKGEPPSTTIPDLVQIPHYDVQASAGNGRFVEEEKVLKTIPFRPEFFTKNLGRNPKDMVIIDATGDSMIPTMNDRDLVMIDTSTASEPITAGIYAYTFEDAVFVKRLQRQPNGLLVTSDNKHYREFRIGNEDLERFRLLGRVVWIGRML